MLSAGMDIVRATTVAIPVFNGEQHLAEAISSVLAQTTRASEVVVFDNASTDTTVAIAERMLGRGSVITSRENIGAVGNFNRAVHSAAGTYFAWLAADDRWDPRFLERTARALDEHPEAPACLTGITYIDCKGEPVGTQVDPELASPELRTRLRSYLRRGRWTEVYCLYRRQALLASPMFRDDFGADVLLMWWFLLRSPLVVLPDLLLEYRLPAARRTPVEMAQALNPSGPDSRWRKVTLWRTLWVMAGDPGVTFRARRVGRRELVLALVHPIWWRHLTEDVLAVSPPAWRLIRLAYRSVHRKHASSTKPASPGQ
jgi:glycosyltransferase involved in cell wall biosynthesis